MLSEEQREATVVCNKDDLLKHIDKDNLTEDMGGTVSISVDDSIMIIVLFSDEISIFLSALS